jgi:2-polyprenyl-3-methyl-5-hydroxy-6-metoxy-1,4-benzoquinol methylase
MQYIEPTLGLSEKIFLNLFCHPVVDHEIESGELDQHEVGSLGRFKRYFGDKFFTAIQEKTVLDVGCGVGSELITVVEEGAKNGIGIDIRENYKPSEKRAEILGIGDRVTYTTQHLSEMTSSSVDVALSQNSFEHYAFPDQILNDTYKALKPGGKMFITFSPPWLHPYGVHMFFMIKRPWAHILFSEKTILTVRKLYRSDGAERYEDVEGGLNKMTIKKFLEYISHSQFELEYLNLNPIRGLPGFFAKIPVLREFTTGAVSAILAKA